ncbi:tetratricopeptide repeat protein [Ketobacter alkanivorans]|nr:tetratricopeptide repeat protein [Ketobacter alkanivorans]
MDIRLDNDEMFHLAIIASKRGDHEKAILLLKQGASEEGSARFHYLLGAEYAEINMLEKAVLHIEMALELNPDIPEAWFQLGLLHSFLNETEKAVNVWRNINQSGNASCLYLFKCGIEKAFDSEWGEAIAFIDQGVEVNTANPELNANMINLKVAWSDRVGEQVVNRNDDPHHFLSAYKEKV